MTTVDWVYRWLCPLESGYAPLRVTQEKLEVCIESVSSEYEALGSGRAAARRMSVINGRASKLNSPLCPQALEWQWKNVVPNECRLYLADTDVSQCSVRIDCLSQLSSEDSSWPSLRSVLFKSSSEPGSPLLSIRHKITPFSKLLEAGSLQKCAQELSRRSFCLSGRVWSRNIPTLCVIACCLIQDKVLYDALQRGSHIKDNTIKAPVALVHTKVACSFGKMWHWHNSGSPAYHRGIPNNIVELPRQCGVGSLSL